MEDIVIREFARGDEPGVCRLAEAVFSMSSDDRFWKWKYWDNPLETNYSYVAESAGRIVGFVGGMPYRFWMSGREFIGGQVTDAMIHPEWRKKGFFFRMNRAAEEKLEKKTAFHYGFSNPVSYKVWKHRYGYEGFNPCKWQKVLDVKSLLLERIRQGKGIRPAAAKLFLRKLLFAQGKPSATCPFEVRELDSFDGRADELWLRVRDSMTIATLRDSRYLNWRYRQNPRNDYMVLAAEDGKRLAGFIVLRCETTDNIKRGFIVDLMADREVAGLAGSLVHESIRWFKSQKAAIANAWMFEHPAECEALKREGFVSKPADPVFLLLNSFLLNDIPQDYLRSLSNWYLLMGDCEVF